MRQLATLPSASAARELADYLLTLQIDTRLLQEPGGWAIWVCDEDRLGQARQEWAEYQSNPHNPRFKGAARAAESLRQQREQGPAPPRQRLVRRPTEVGGRHRVTAMLISASVVVTFATNMCNFGTSGLARDLAIAPLAVRDHQLYKLPLWVGLRHGQVWRLVTPIFLHGSIWHLLFNMVLLYQLGSRIEERRGWWRLLLLVLACAVASNLAQYYYGDTTSPGQGSPLFGGMSGVVYALFGYVWMKAVFEPDLGLGMQASTIVYLMAWFFLCMSSDFQQLIGVSVANMAHGVGLLSGMAFGVAPTVFRLLAGGLRRGH
jgi:GlpG protein